MKRIHVDLRYKRTRAFQHVCACLKIHPFACSHCGRAFSRKFALKRHIEKGATCGGATINIVNL